MFQKFIVRAIRPDKSIEILADETIEMGKQKEILYANSTNTKFAEVQMFQLEPLTRVFHPTSVAESARQLAADKSNSESITVKTNDQKHRK